MQNIEILDVFKIMMPEGPFCQIRAHLFQQKNTPGDKIHANAI